MSEESIGLSEVSDGVLQWSAPHPRIGMIVHSAFLPAPDGGGGVAIDPVGAEWLGDALAEAGGVERIVLSNRHHTRACEELVERFGADVVAPASGMHEFGPDTSIKPYEWGEEVAPGVTAHEIGVICPDDGALHIARGDGALLIADSVIRWEGRLSFVPDILMDEPEQTKAGTLTALEPLLELEFEALLLAHGEPVQSGGREQLRAFIDDPYQADFGV
jgi:hypothetical protein